MNNKQKLYLSKAASDPAFQAFGKNYYMPWQDKASFNPLKSFPVAGPVDHMKAVRTQGKSLGKSLGKAVRGAGQAASKFINSKPTGMLEAGKAPAMMPQFGQSTGVGTGLLGKAMGALQAPSNNNTSKLLQAGQAGHQAGQAGHQPGAMLGQAMRDITKPVTEAVRPAYNFLEEKADLGSGMPQFGKGRGDYVQDSNNPRYGAKKNLGVTPK